MTQPNSTNRLAVSLALAGLVGATCVHADEPATALLQEVKGAPTIVEAGDARAQPVLDVAVGRRYPLPLVVETHHGDSATFALANSVIAVAPDTSMRIVAPEQAGGGGVIQRVLEQSGSSLFSVKRGTVERFQVETPFLVSVVKGTIFNVLVRDDGATVALQQGHLEVRSLDASHIVELSPGDVAFAGRDGTPRLLAMKPAGQNASANAHPASDAPATATDAARDAKPVDATASDTTKTVVATVDDATRATDASSTGIPVKVVDATGTAVPVAVGTVSETVSTVVSATDTTVTSATAPLVSAAAPVVNAAAPIVAAAAPVVTSVVTTVAPVIDGVSSTTPAVTSPVAPVTSAVAPVTGAVTGAVHSTLSALTGHGGRP